MGDAAAPWPGSVHAAAQVFVADLEGLQLDSDHHHHLLRVLRVKAGEQVVASDGRGRWRACRFTGGKAGAALDPDGAVIFCERPLPLVTVAFVPVKGDRPEWVVQKLTELGVDRIGVLQSRRAVVRWEEERAVRVLERFRRVAREAAAQSRRPWLPDVTGVHTLESMAAEVAPAPLALAALGGDPPSLEVPSIAVGPEGGWDDVEIGGRSAVVGLGRAVLRSETAAVAAGTLLGALRDGIVVQRG